MSMTLGNSAFYVIPSGRLSGHRPGSRFHQEYRQERAVTENPALAVLDSPAGGILGAPAY